MKKIIFILLLCAAALSGFSQAWQQNFYKPGQKANGYWADSIFRAPSDTTVNKTGIAVKGTTMYIGNGTKWTAISGGSISGLTSPYVPYWNGSALANSILSYSGSYMWTGTTPSYGWGGELFQVSGNTAVKGTGWAYSQVVGGASDTIASGAAFQLTSPPFTPQAQSILQLNAIGGLDLWNYDTATTTWSKAIRTDHLSNLYFPSLGSSTQSNILYFNSSTGKVSYGIVPVIPNSIHKVYGTNGVVNVNDSTLQGDSVLMATRARVQKPIDSLGIVKVNVSDTSSMLTNYRNNISALINDSSYQAAQILLRVKYTDTSSMLSPYQRSAFAVKYSDTANIVSGYQRKLTLTTTGSSGAATLDAYGNINIPQYSTSLSGYVQFSDTTYKIASRALPYKINDSMKIVNAATYVPQTRTLTINGTALDLSANRSWSVGTVTSVATSVGLTGGTITSTGTLQVDTGRNNLKIPTGNDLNQVKDSLLAVATHGTVTSVAALTLGTTGTDLSSGVTNSTTTPVITLNVPTANATNRGALSSADWTTFNSKQSALSGTGFVKISGTTISYDNSTYLTGNQTITLSGDVSGSGTTAITTAIGAGKVTNAMLAGSIAASKLVGTDITTVGTITSGVWHGSTIDNAYLTTAYLPLAGGTLTGTLIGTGIVLTNVITASSFNTIGGTASQFLKANGTLDNNTYLTTSSASSTYVPYSGATGTVNLNGQVLTNVGGYSGNNISLAGGSTGTFVINANGSAITPPANGFSMATGYGVSYLTSHNGAGSAVDLYIDAPIIHTAAISGTSASFSSTTASSSYTTGALVVSGGVGIAGALNVNSSVIASSFYESSDIRLKNIVERRGDMIQFTWKDGRDNLVHTGYSAQEVKQWMPTAVMQGSDGYLSVQYLEVHTKKINDLEKEVAELKKQIKSLKK